MLKDSIKSCVMNKVMSFPLLEWSYRVSGAYSQLVPKANLTLAQTLCPNSIPNPKPYSNPYTNPNSNPNLYPKEFWRIKLGTSWIPAVSGINDSFICSRGIGWLIEIGYFRRDIVLVRQFILYWLISFVWICSGRVQYCRHLLSHVCCS